MIGIERHLRRGTTFEGHHPDVPVSGTIAGECDPFAIGADRGHDVFSGIGSESRDRLAVDSLAVQIRLGRMLGGGVDERRSGRVDFRIEIRSFGRETDL